MKAVIYTRVSTKGQLDNLSLPVQEEGCRAYCRREGLEVDRLFVERGESAKTVNRPEFQRMLAYCRAEKGRVAVLVVYNLSRFSRDVTDHHIVRRSLMEVGVTLRSVSEPISDTPGGRLQETVYGAFHQHENELRGQRSLEGMKAAVARGRWVWKTPLGYVSAPEAPGGLLLDERAAPILRRAFEAVASGIPASEALREMQALGLTLRNGRPITRPTWSKMLASPVYKGTIAVERWAVEARAAFPALVDEVTYARVQAVLGGRELRGRRHSREHPDFPLRVFLRCAHCDTPLTAAWSRGKGGLYAYYWCRRHCERPSRRETVEGAWAAYLDRIRPDAATFALLEEGIRCAQARRGGDVDARRKALRQHIEQCERKKARLFEVYAYDQAIDKGAYAVENERLNLELSTAQVTLFELERGQSEDAAAVLREARALVLNPAGLWRKADPGLKCEFQSALFPRGGTYAHGAVLNCPTWPIFRDLGAESVGAVAIGTPQAAALNLDWSDPLSAIVSRFRESGLMLEARP